MTSFTDRLNQALAESGHTPKALQAVLRGPKGKMGVSATAVSEALSGGTKSLTAENAARAARFLGVEVYWLCTGEGPMRAEPGTPAALSVEVVAERFGRVLATLGPMQREAAAQVLAGWARDGGADHWMRMFVALASDDANGKPHRRAA